MSDTRQTPIWRTHPMAVGAVITLVISRALNAAGNAPVAFGIEVGWLLAIIVSEIRVWGIVHGRCC